MNIDPFWSAQGMSLAGVPVALGFWLVLYLIWKGGHHGA